MNREVNREVDREVIREVDGEVNKEVDGEVNGEVERLTVRPPNPAQLGEVSCFVYFFKWNSIVNSFLVEYFLSRYLHCDQESVPRV